MFLFIVVFSTLSDQGVEYSYERDGNVTREVVVVY